MTSPVALFIFRRPELTRLVFNRIAEYRPEKLFVIADGPRDSILGELQLTEQSRLETMSIDWPCEVIRIYSDTNLGFQERFFTGLDQVFEAVDSCIILEDDCLPTSSFFTFCESLIETYAETPDVGIISGSNFSPQHSNSSYFFSANSYIWGWATWSRTWKKFESADRKEVFTRAEARALRPSYATYWERLFSERLIRSLPLHKGWDVPFSVFLRRSGFVNVVPNSNLIDNLGQAGNGTNEFLAGWEKTPPALGLDFPLRHPDSRQRDWEMDKRMWRARGTSLLKFFLSNPAKLLRRFFQELRLNFSMIRSARPFERERME